MRESAAAPGTYANGTRSPVVYVYLCPSCAGYELFTPEDYTGALTNGCQGCGKLSREVHRFPAVITSAGGCACHTQHPRVTGDLPDTHNLTMEVQRAWDKEFARPWNTAVDFRQARIAVETILGLATHGRSRDDH